MTSISRRTLLRAAGALGATGPLAPFALNMAAIGKASAATAGDYRALVCIFMYGGNDAYNSVLATDSASWSAYTTARSSGSQPIALAAVGTPASATGSTFSAKLGGPLTITPSNAQSRTFALHPSMTGMRDLFAAGRLGVVANVGTLLRPTTKAQYATATFAKPSKLFSHNDQQSMWQTFGVEGTTTGWGGKFSDLLLSNNTQTAFSAISLNGNASWLAGQQTRMYQLATSGSIKIGAANGTLYGSSTARSQLLAIARNSRGSNLIEQDHAAVVGRSIDADLLLAGALPSATAGAWGTSSLASGASDPLLQYVNPQSGATEVNPLALQLQTVARTISARGALGMSRQMFFVGLDGFDTHATQAQMHAVAMARLSHAMAYFDAALTGMGVGSNVTTFTASDFGRTFTSNGDGTDHGWGAHHFVMGGAVQGGDIYGTFPTYGLSDGKGGFSSPNQIGGGVMLPTTSVDQYAATLGRWFGASDAAMLGILPNLANFDSGTRNLGFV